MVPKTFRFPDMPHLVQKNIIDGMDLVALIHLALKNKAFMKIVKLLKVQLSCMRIFYESKLNVFCSKDERNCSFIKVEPSTDDIVPTNKPRLISMNYPDYCAQFEMCWPGVNDDDEASHKLLEYLFTFIKTYEMAVYIERKVDHTTFVPYKITRKFKTISCGAKRDVSPEEDYIIPFQITGEHLKFLLEETETDELMLNVNIEGPYTYRFSPERVYKHQNLVILSMQWFDSETILFSDARKIRCRVPNHHCIEINRMLKSWIKGNNKKLEVIRFDNSSSYKEVFEGIVSKRDSYGSYIERDCDGAKASVMCLNFYHGMYKMIVWGNRDHKEVIRFGESLESD